MLLVAFDLGIPMKKTVTMIRISNKGLSALVFLRFNTLKQEVGGATFKFIDIA
jgi:hypothetical protein